MAIHRQPELYEAHTHTPLCKHAVGTPSDYAAVAHAKGLKGMIVTCHNPMPEGFSPRVRMSMEQLPEYVELVESATETWRGKVDVLLGLESDFVPGAESWIESVHSKADFHYILGSIHPHLSDYRKRFFTGDDREYQETYFSHLVMAAQSGLFDCLAHPDLIKNSTVSSWNVPSLLDPIRRALDKIAATGIAMELNTSGMNKAIPEMNPGPEILAEIHARSIPIVLGADAHVPERVGDRYPEAITMLQQIGFQTISGFRNRQRYEIPLDAALAHFGPLPETAD